MHCTARWVPTAAAERNPCAGCQVLSTHFAVLQRLLSAAPQACESSGSCCSPHAGAQCCTVNCSECSPQPAPRWCSRQRRSPWQADAERLEGRRGHMLESRAGRALAGAWPPAARQSSWMWWQWYVWQPPRGGWHLQAFACRRPHCKSVNIEGVVQGSKGRAGQPAEQPDATLLQPLLCWPTDAT